MSLRATSLPKYGRPQFYAYFLRSAAWHKHTEDQMHTPLLAQAHLMDSYRGTSASGLYIVTVTL